MEKKKKNWLIVMFVDESNRINRSWLEHIPMEECIFIYRWELSKKKEQEEEQERKDLQIVV